MFIRAVPDSHFQIRQESEPESDLKGESGRNRNRNRILPKKSVLYLNITFKYALCCQITICFEIKLVLNIVNLNRSIMVVLRSWKKTERGSVVVRS